MPTVDGTWFPLVEGEATTRVQDVDTTALAPAALPVVRGSDGARFMNSAFQQDLASNNITCTRNLFLPRQVTLGQNTQIQAVGKFFIIDDPTTPDRFSVAPFSVVFNSTGSTDPIIFNFSGMLPLQVVQSDDTQTLGNTTIIAAEGALNSGGALVSQYRFRFAADLDGISVEVRQDDENGELIYTSDFLVNATQGQDALFEEGSRRFGFFAGESYHLTFTSPNGTPQLLGDSDGVAYYARIFQPFTIDTVATTRNVASIISTLPETNPFSYYESLEQGNGILTNAEIVTAASIPESISNTGDGLEFTLVAERTTAPGFKSGIPIEYIFQGGINARTTGSTTTKVTARFFRRFDAGGTEFVRERTVELRVASNRREPLPVVGWEDTLKPVIGETLRGANEPITQAMLDGTMTYRIELRIQLFDITSSDNRVTSTLDLLEFTDLEMDFRQHARIIGPQGEKGDPGDAADLPAGIQRLRNTVVNLSSPEVFEQSLNGVTIANGDGFIVGTASALGVTMWGTTAIPSEAAVGVGNIIYALTDDPTLDDFSPTDQWTFVLAKSLSVTESDKFFLAEKTEIDTTVETPTLDNATAPFRVWLLDNLPIDDTLLTEGESNGDNAATDNRFEQSQNSSGQFLIIRFETPYINSAAGERIHIRVADRLNEDATILDLPLSTRWNELAFSDATHTYYAYSRFQIVDSYTLFNYRNNEEIFAYLSNIERRFDLSSNINALPAIDNIPESKLDDPTQAKLNADRGLDTVDRERMNLFVPTETIEDQTPYSGSEEILGRLHPSSGVLGAPRPLENDVNGGLFPAFEESTRTWDVYWPDNIEVLSYDGEQEGTATISEIIPSDVGGKRQYRVVLPLPAGLPSVDNVFLPSVRVTTRSGNFSATNDLSVGTGNYENDSVTKPDLSPSLRNQIDANTAAAGSSNPRLPEKIQRLSDDLTITTLIGPRWGEVSPAPVPFKIEREYLILPNNDEQPFGDNEFEDIEDIRIEPVREGNKSFQYGPGHADRRFNTDMPGRDNYVLNDPVPIRNINGGSNLKSSRTKIVEFYMAVQRRVVDGEDFTFLGDDSGRKWLGFDHQYGLYVEIGSDTPINRSVTEEVFLAVIRGQWSIPVDVSTSGSTEVIIPDGESGAFTATTDTTLFVEGNEEDTHTEVFNITDVSSDEDFGVRVFTWSYDDNGSTLILNSNITCRYEAANTDIAGQTRRIIILEYTVDNAGRSFNLEAHHTVTSNWTTPAQKAKFSVNAGNPHGPNGLFNPDVWQDEQPFHVVRGLMLWRDYRYNDSDADPEQELLIVTQGTDANAAMSDYSVRTHKPASEFDQLTPTYETTIFGRSGMGSYVWSADNIGQRPTIEHLRTLFTGGEALGYFHREGESVDELQFNAAIQARRFIGTDDELVHRSSSSSVSSTTLPANYTDYLYLEVLMKELLQFDDLWFPITIPINELVQFGSSDRIWTPYGTQAELRFDPDPGQRLLSCQENGDDSNVSAIGAVTLRR